MKTVNIHEAKTHLSKLLTLVASGEEVVIAKAGKPVAKLVPVDQPKTRVFGTLKGQYWVSEDFDAPDPEFEALFYGDDSEDPL